MTKEELCKLQYHELIKLIDEGRLIYLPCKVGETIYQIGSICTNAECANNTNGQCDNRFNIRFTGKNTPHEWWHEYCSKHLKLVPVERIFPTEASIILANKHNIFSTKDDVEKALAKMETEQQKEGY